MINIQKGTKRNKRRSRVTAGVCFVSALTSCLFIIIYIKMTFFFFPFLLPSIDSTCLCLSLSKHNKMSSFGATVFFLFLCFLSTISSSLLFVADRIEQKKCRRTKSVDLQFVVLETQSKCICNKRQIYSYCYVTSKLRLLSWNGNHSIYETQTE